MLFDMKNELLHFQLAINLMLGGLVDLYILVYLDNILIYLAIAKDYSRHIRAVFEWLVRIKALPEI